MKLSHDILQSNRGAHTAIIGDLPNAVTGGRYRWNEGMHATRYEQGDQNDGQSRTLALTRHSHDVMHEEGRMASKCFPHEFVPKHPTAQFDGKGRVSCGRMNAQTSMRKLTHPKNLCTEYASRISPKSGLQCPGTSPQATAITARKLWIALRAQYSMNQPVNAVWIMIIHSR